MNRRSQKTRRDITHVFLELLREKPLRSITVKEVADAAEVTRATFYSHYHDLYDLLDQTRSDAVAQVVSMFDQSIPIGNPLVFTTALFSYLDEREEVFALVLGEDGDISFLVTIMRKLREKKTDIMPEFTKKALQECSNEELFNYQFLYMAGGILSMLTEWLSQGKKTPVDVMAAMAAQFIENTCLMRVATPLCDQCGQEVNSSAN